MNKKSSKHSQIIIIAILMLAVNYFAFNMIQTGIGLDFNLFWHWIFIICFSFTTLMNLRSKSYIGIAIGLSGMFICVLSLILMAFSL
ncbi:hypothetical protein [Listeria fleischmannii]|uniref:hypothetical protein n=1 Tax=Listeria fleischmannii TaxID=1069827 RepID=UPI001625E56D|nr:hypothetical protein [Listeria fleischmannii]MBC1419246.1 hypothetical protein [Listeria fleischmannii]